MKVKVESEKVALKYNIQKIKTMASSPTTTWQIDGETVETVSDFIFWGLKLNIQKTKISENSVRLYILGSKITADGDCSH